MTPERKVLLGDGCVGVSILLSSAVLYDGGGTLGSLGAVVAALTTWAVLYCSDRGMFEGWVSELVAVGALIGLPLLFAGVLAIVQPSVGPFALPIFGVGIGVLANRFVYGVVKPIPAYRLDRVPEQAV